jgi:integrase
MAMPAKKSSPSSDTRYLQRIGSRWYARIPVPNKLRGELGPYIRKSLDTSDIHEARQRRWDVLEMARKTIAKQEAKGKPQGVSKEELSYTAFRAKLKELGPHVISDQHGDEMYNPLIDDLIDEVREGRAPEDSDLAHALSDHITGREPVSETLKSYLEANPKRNATTVKNYETTVKLWIAKNKDRPIDRVTRRQALEWLEEVAEGKARDTVKRYATVMGHLWSWAHRKEEDPPKNPFEDLLKRIGSKGRAAESYGFYTEDELKQAYAAVSEDDELRPVFLISIYTGFRLDECLRAERRNVHGVECFVLEGGKSENASRVVPIHPRLKDVVAPKGAKASALSVRYGRLMRSIKMPEGKTFHSLRKAFTTALERADCPEAIAARLVGHAPLGITYRVYSQGREAAQLRVRPDIHERRPKRRTRSITEAA